ncbi:hypothetical protein P171DRAFT_231534 [Karstenula rhodostoma CBS 690.94]|uniref:Uncharacterized protein n=1 Tax=Karstenula rhodostoma CBS 690.94 TaxID=1392251 RepID=A0A9P4PPH9_9PLEO|nr:hypothetical protein P171DRAFT_231534 [Karstenula rhodostoma CBS 690.94]
MSAKSARYKVGTCCLLAVNSSLFSLLRLLLPFRVHRTCVLTWLKRNGMAAKAYNLEIARRVCSCGAASGWRQQRIASTNQMGRCAKTERLSTVCGQHGFSGSSTRCRWLRAASGFQDGDSTARCRLAWTVAVGGFVKGFLSCGCIGMDGRCAIRVFIYTRRRSRNATVPSGRV